MFSQVFVCPQGWESLVSYPFQGGGYHCYQVPHRGVGAYIRGWVSSGVGMSRGYSPTDMGPRQYISCQNISVLSVHNNKSEDYVVISTKINERL